MEKDGQEIKILSGEVIFIFKKKFKDPVELRRSQTTGWELEDLNKSHQTPCDKGHFWWSWSMRMMSGEVSLLEMEPLGIWDILLDAIGVMGEGRVYVSFDLFLNFGQ